MTIPYRHFLKVVEYERTFGYIQDVRDASYTSSADVPREMYPYGQETEVIYVYPDPVTRYVLDGVELMLDTHYVHLHNNEEQGTAKLRAKTVTEMILSKEEFVANDDEKIEITIPGVTDNPDAEIWQSLGIFISAVQKSEFSALGRRNRQIYVPEQQVYNIGIDTYQVTPGEKIEIILPSAGTWDILFNSLRYHAPPHDLSVQYDYHDELIRQANLLSLAGNFNTYDLLKRNLNREIIRLRREESYIEASDAEKLAEHYEACVPVSDEGSMATYLTTLSRVCECVIVALSDDEARKIYPVATVDKRIVVPVSMALDVIWICTYRHSSVYRGALPDQVSTKIEYSHVFEAPDQSRSICAPEIALIDSIVDRWCAGILAATDQLLRSQMTNTEFSNVLRQLFSTALVVEEDDAADDAADDDDDAASND